VKVEDANLACRTRLEDHGQASSHYQALNRLDTTYLRRCDLCDTGTLRH
jgi:hypothetical protein